MLRLEDLETLPDLWPKDLKPEIDRLETNRDHDDEEIFNDADKLIKPDEENQTYNLVENFDKDFIDMKADPVEEGGEMCDSCYSMYDPKDFFALVCGHRFCINCNRDHL